MTQIATHIRRRLSNSGLLPLAFTVYRALREWTPKLMLQNRRARQSSALPVPPNSLIFSATGTRHVEWFLRSGELSAKWIRQALNDLGRPLETFTTVLDLGCGCGRVMRQWYDVRNAHFHGSDYNPAGIDWAAEKLPKFSFSTNQLEPPLNFGAAFFDLVYAISVFTHLPEFLQRPWIEELHRVIKPGGILLLTLSGEGDFYRVTGPERERFNNGELVVVDPDYAGTNICGVYHPEAYVRASWGDIFELKRVYPKGASGSPNQDVYVFERQ